MKTPPQIFESLPNWIEQGQIHWQWVVFFLLVIAGILALLHVIRGVGSIISSLFLLLFLYAYVGQVIHSDFTQWNPILALSGMGAICHYIWDHGWNGFLEVLRSMLWVFFFDLPIAIRDFIYNYFNIR